MAAGSGTRFGGGKLLARFRGESLYRRTLELLPGQALDAVAVVSGEPDTYSADALISCSSRFFLTRVTASDGVIVIIRIRG